MASEEVEYSEQVISMIFMVFFVLFERHEGEPLQCLGPQICTK